MRNSYRSSRSRSTIQWKWIAMTIVVLFGIFWLFSSKELSTNGTGEYLAISLGKDSAGMINISDTKKRQITKDERLYVSDKSLTISSGSAKLTGSGILVYMDMGEVSLLTSTGTHFPGISLTRGRVWLESQGELEIRMKNLQAKLISGDIVLLEQLNPIYSILYVLKGDVPVISGGRNYVLNSGKRIMISQSDLANTTNTLDGLAGPIDDAIKQNPFFIAHGGEVLLANTSKGSGSGLNISISGSSLISNSGAIGLEEKFIEITTPVDGSTVNTNSINIDGKILSKNVKKILFNDKEALISPVNQSFTLKDFPLITETTDIVYKVFDAGGNTLLKSVFTVKSKSKSLGTDKLIPTTFGTGDKNYKIVSPLENPYRTSEDTVTVSGVIPKNTVSYITVNNYRLRKFIAGSGNWYYFAGIKNETMKEGFNLYDIRFYDSNDSLLSSQVFTIINEPSGTVSGEVNH